MEIANPVVQLERVAEVPRRGLFGRPKAPQTFRDSQTASMIDTRTVRGAYTTALSAARQMANDPLYMSWNPAVSVGVVDAGEGAFQIGRLQTDQMQLDIQPMRVTSWVGPMPEGDVAANQTLTFSALNPSLRAVVNPYRTVEFPTGQTRIVEHSTT